jgi:methylmalonyl-CoA mutase N-terminal domain/subunit
MDQVEATGGALKAIETGFIQLAIHRSAYEHQKGVERGEIGVVGVNRHRVDEEVRPQIFQVSEETARRQAERLEAVKRRRDSAAVERALAALEEAARGTANLMPPLHGAIREYASVGEICGRLRTVFGSYRDPGFV